MSNQRVTRAKHGIRGRVYDDFPGFATNGYDCHAKSFPNSCLTEILPGTNFVMGGSFRHDLPWDDPGLLRKLTVAYS